MLTDSGTYTPETLERRRKIAEALFSDSQKPKPIRHWLEGAAQVAEAGLRGYQLNQLDKEISGGENAARAEIAKLLMPGGDNAAPQPAANPAQPPASTPPQGDAPPMANDAGGGPYQGAIAGIESGGKYDVLGPVTKTGDRAYGKYQVMGSNIGPWSREALGREVTPQEFIADPKIQDAVFNHRFGQYADKYGPEGAAKAWFAGERGMNDPTRKDQLGTTVQAYGDRFNAALGQQPYKVAGPAVAPPAMGPAENATGNGGNNAKVAQVLTQGATAAQPGVAPAAGGGSDVRARVAALLNHPNPYVRAEGMKYAQALLAAELKPRDYGFQTLPDGTILRTDPRGGTVTPVYQGPVKKDFGFQTLPDGTIIRTDPKEGTVSPVYQGGTKPTWGVIGEDAYGEKKYGWINAGTQTVTPYGGGGQSAPQPSPQGAQVSPGAPQQQNSVSPPASIGGGGAPGPAPAGSAPVITGPGGQPIPVPPGVDPKEFRKQVTHATADAATGKKTEVQANSEQFANRMEDAEKNYGDVEPKIRDSWRTVGDRAIDTVSEGTYNPIPKGWTNPLLSKEYQSAKQAKSQFITALLRRESGAAIHPSEFDRYDQEFFPQQGDDASVVAQKANARRVAIEGMKKGAGPGYHPPAAPSGPLQPGQVTTIGNVKIQRID